MSTAQRNSPTFAFIIIFCLSLLAAGILYGLLESTGMFETKGMRLGGAAGGFIVILIISHRIFASIQKRIELQTDKKEIAERDSCISVLKQEVERLSAAQIPEIRCP